MTQTLEIPKEKWGRFLEHLGQGALGQTVRIEVEKEDLGDQLVGTKLPLRGIELESKGSQQGDLLIYLGKDDGTLSHRIEGARRIWVGHDDENRLEWLAIEQEGEGKTLLYFDERVAVTEEAARD